MAAAKHTAAAAVAEENGKNTWKHSSNIWREGTDRWKKSTGLYYESAFPVCFIKNHSSRFI